MADRDPEYKNWCPYWGLLAHAPLDRVRMILSGRRPEYGGARTEYRHVDGWTAFFWHGLGELDDDAATRLVEHGFETVLLDFHDEADNTRFWDGKHWVADMEESPYVVVRKHGMKVPGFEEPRPPPRPHREACLIEGLTLDTVKAALKDQSVQILAAPRGVVVLGQNGGFLAEEMGARVFDVVSYLDDGSFSCTVFRGNDVDGALKVPATKGGAGFPVLDSIEGERTLPGILRVLGIPLEALLSTASERNDLQAGDPHADAVPDPGQRHVSVFRSACVVEGASPEMLKDLYDPSEVEAIASPRGTVLFGDDLEPFDLMERTGRTVYELGFDPETKRFVCVVRAKGKDPETWENVHRPIDSNLRHLSEVLGQSTPAAILGELGVPRERILGESTHDSAVALAPPYRPPPQAVREVYYIEGARADDVQRLRNGEWGEDTETLPGTDGVTVIGHFNPFRYGNTHPHVRVYWVSYDVADQSFICNVIRLDNVEASFAIGTSTKWPNQVSSIRGETTPEGILRSFGLPPERLLGPPTSLVTS